MTGIIETLYRIVGYVAIECFSLLQNVHANVVGIETSWLIKGSVSHFGHMQYRQNRYHSIIWIIPDNGIWKIENIEMLDEERLL